MIIKTLKNLLNLTVASYEVDVGEEEFIVNWKEGKLISYEYEDLYQRANIAEFEDESSCMSAFKELKESFIE